jgi:hypothetical protein
MSLMELWVKLILVSLISNCSPAESDDPAPYKEDDLFGVYGFQFDPTKQQFGHTLEISARFHYQGYEGSGVILRPPSSVQHGGKELELNAAAKAGDTSGKIYYYKHQNVTAPAESYQFIWYRRDGTAYQNEIESTTPLVTAPPPNGGLIALTDPIVAEFTHADVDQQSFNPLEFICTLYYYDDTETSLGTTPVQLVSQAPLSALSSSAIQCKFLSGYSALKGGGVRFVSQLKRTIESIESFAGHETRGAIRQLTVFSEFASFNTPEPEQEEQESETPL